MARSNFFKGYRIARHYSRCTVWTFKADTKALMGTVQVVPKRDLTPRSKFNVITEFLAFRKNTDPGFPGLAQKIL